MYAGLFISRHSGNWLGAHQKFNKIAYRLVLSEVDYRRFPSIDDILHFEGKGGPDALDIKSGGKGKPSHFYDPQEGRGAVIDEIRNHYVLLVSALAKHDRVRAAFEASWLAHAITDGLTPAHHFPYEAEVGRLKTGRPAKSKPQHRLIVPGKTKTHTLRHTWKMIGAKGLLSTHMHFEFGVAAAIATWRFNLQLSPAMLESARSEGPLRFFKDQARMIAGLSLYERFYRSGWTVNLARAVRKLLAPAIAETIAIIWLLAYEEAGYKLRSS